MAGNKPVFVGNFTDAERRVMECIFESAWLSANSARLIQPEADKAEHQRRQLALIVTRMMSRRQDSIGELADAAFRHFRDSQPLPR